MEEQKLTRSELISKLSKINPQLYQQDLEKVVVTIFDEIMSALARGDRVELRGFGTFSVKTREARLARNPRTGESVKVKPKATPAFRMGKELRERLNIK